MNRVMVDFAKLDKRSVSAGLRGKDDGRVRCYERAFRRFFALNKNMEQRDLIYTVGDFMDTELPRQILWNAYLRHQLQEVGKGIAEGARHVFIFLIGCHLAIGLVSQFCRAG